MVFGNQGVRAKDKASERFLVCLSLKGEEVRQGCPRYMKVCALKILPLQIVDQESSVGAYACRSGLEDFTFIFCRACACQEILGDTLMPLSSNTYLPSWYIFARSCCNYGKMLPILWYFYALAPSMVLTTQTLDQVRCINFFFPCET